VSLRCLLGKFSPLLTTPFARRSFRIGSAPRNACSVPPLSPYACWPPHNYAAVPGRIHSVVSAHIHAAALGEDGRLWSWGCGSNDGRCGVERFLNMAGEGKPIRVDAMKCYMMGPHRVGCARAVYWPHGPSLDGEHLHSHQGWNIKCISSN
jgi:hypothetical protein